MAHEALLADSVRKLAASVVDNESLADRAVDVALAASAGGASTSESYRQARSFLGSWIGHPSHAKAIQRMRASLAS
jgi:hypothetical protein